MARLCQSVVFATTILGEKNCPGSCSLQNRAEKRSLQARKALALTTDVTPRYCEADPYEGGKQAVAEAWRNLTAVGATPLALTDWCRPLRHAIHR